MAAIALFVAYLFLFFWLIGKLSFFRFEKIPVSMLRACFLLKVAAGAAMAWIYTYYYTGRAEADIFRYFDDSRVIFEAFFTDTVDFLRIFFGIKSTDPYLYRYYDQMICWDAYHTNIVIRFNVLARFFSLGNYYIHVLFISFLSLAGLTGILKVFGSEFRNKARLAGFLVLFTPSVLFWTSGVLKEGVLISALGLFFYFFYRLKERISLRHLLPAIFLIPVLVTGKGFVMAVLAPLLLSWIVSRKYDRYPAVFFGFLTFFALCAIFISQLVPALDLPALIAARQKEFIFLSESEKAGSYLNSFMLESNWASILKNIPMALLNALMRPSPFDSYSVFTFAAAVENIILLMLIGISLLYSSRKNTRSNLFCFSLSFALILLVIIGLTTPVMGAAVRYRVPALPFLIISLVILMDTEKLKRTNLLNIPSLWK
jgi:hypothetical protein